MGGGTTSKQTALTVGGVLLLGGALGYAAYALSQNNDPDAQIVAKYALERAPPAKAALFVKLIKEIQAVRAQPEGAHLKESFFALLDDWVEVTAGHALRESREEIITKIANDYKAMKYSEFAKKTSAYAKFIQEVEDDALEEFFSSIDKQDVDLINASRIYQIKYNADKYLPQTLKGSSIKNDMYLKQVNEFNLSDVLNAIHKIVTSRLSRGVEGVDPIWFPLEFRIQIEAEVTSRFPHIKFDEFWAFVVLEDLKEEQQKWDTLIHDYTKLLKLFYHRQELYSPGIKIM